MSCGNPRISLLLATGLAVACALVFGGCASQTTRSATANSLDQILSGPQRNDRDRSRDAYRHPRQTLLFFGIRPEMTVVEISPGNGWYTRVIAPLLRDRGRYLAAMAPRVAGEAESERQHNAFAQMIAAAPNQLDRVEVVPFLPGRAAIAPPGSVDMILTFRNMHNWMNHGQAAAAFADMYGALKPGGVLGVVDHRGNPQVPQDPRAQNGYVNQAYAIKLIESAGFRLVGISEVNANPRDTKDYAGGVWDLPPTLAEGGADRARYVAIGESDRFTLKFVKPR